MKKIFLTAIATLFFLSSFAQSQVSGLVFYVTDSAAFTGSTTIVNAHATGKADIFWNAQATTPHFDWWNGSAYVHGFGVGSGGTSLTAGSGITIVGDSINWNGQITEDVVMNGAFDVDIGQTTALTSFKPQAQYMAITAIDSLNLSIAGSLGTNGQVLKSDGTKAVWGNDTGTGSVNTFAKNVQSGNYTLQQSDTVRTTLMSSASNQTLTLPTGIKGGSIFMVMQDSANTVTIDASAVTVDENPSGTLTLTRGYLATIFYKNSNRVVISKPAASAGGGHIIQDEGTSVTARDTLDFAGAGVTLSDVSGRTVVTIPEIPARYVIDQATPSTAGATITLDMNSQIQRSHVGSATFAAAKALALSNTTYSMFFNFTYTITNIAAVLTCPSTFQSADSNWDPGADTWTPTEAGKYEMGGSFDGTNWIIKFYGPVE